MTLKSWRYTFAVGVIGVVCSSGPARAGTVLGTAQAVAVLGASNITNTGATTVHGDIDLDPGTSLTNTGSITQTGTIHITDGVSLQARTDAISAYGILAGLTPTTDLSGQNLGGLTLGPGVYTFSSSAQLTGILTLDFAGGSNRDIVFKIFSTLTTASGSSVVIQNGSATDGVFFAVGSSATLGTSTTFAGNILADQAITMNTTAKIQCGRAIALHAAVTMDTNTISNDCGAGDFNSGGFSGGDFVSLGYTGGGFNGIPPAQVGAATPEPSTVGLLSFGLLVMLGLATRGRRVSLPAPSVP